MKYPAIPLITNDPFFSIWSVSDELYGGVTRHWSGKTMPLYIAVKIDGKYYAVCGADNNYFFLCKRIKQTGVEVTPLSTIYTFENELIKLTLKFTSPLLLDRPDILARPVSYIDYKIERKQEVKEVKFVFGIGAICCANHNQQQVEFKRTSYSMSCGNSFQTPLACAGDCNRIEWGWLHLCEDNVHIAHWISGGANIRYREPTLPCLPSSENYHMVVEKEEDEGFITVAYDEIYAFEYFGKPVEEYYKKYFPTFGEMIKTAKAEHDEILGMCAEFDKVFVNEAMKFGEDYKNIVTPAYRQAIAAHKLAEDEDGNLIFISKECASNGCAGTVDVTYPSIPMFLKFAPEYVFAMLRPIIKYANSKKWNFTFAPHDVGCYPLVNGQVYGANKEELQMPVEECGNMIICAGAACEFIKDKSFFEENKELFRQWADYLTEFGYDPGNQLCTDDFTGHLSHNCNLSVKAIVALGVFSKLSGDEKYMNIAKEMAEKWEKDAKNAEGTRLTFDNEEGWSLKYNMVWDNILNLGLFSDAVKQKEIELYKTKINRYGVPLDNRADYTKLDWLMWTTKLADDKEYFDMAIESIKNMFAETIDRVPMTDWYCTKTAFVHSFRGRSVVGGLFINML